MILSWNKKFWKLKYAGPKPGLCPGTASAHTPLANFFAFAFSKLNLEHKTGVTTKCLEKAPHPQNKYVISHGHLAKESVKVAKISGLKVKLSSFENYRHGPISYHRSLSIHPKTIRQIVVFFFREGGIGDNL